LHPRHLSDSRVIPKLLQDLAMNDDIPEEEDGEARVRASGGSNYAGLPMKAELIAFGPVNAINEAIKQLSTGLFAHLISSFPMTPSTSVHHNANQLISPSKNRTPEALK